MSTGASPVPAATEVAEVSVVDRIRRRLSGAITPLRLPITAVAAALVLAGAFLPWTTFDFGYPGWLQTSGAGGHRLYLVLLTAALALVVRPVDGARRAVLAATLGMVVITVVNLGVITKDGGGFGALAIGGWLALVGSVAALAVADSMPDSPRGRARRLAPVPSVVVVIGTVALCLWLVVLGLKIDDSKQFLGYLLFLAVAAIALNAVGVLPTYSAAAQRYHAVFLAAVAVAALAFPFTQGGSEYWINVASQVVVFAAAAIGLNVVVGLAGLLDLGYIAFFGVGAYTAALLSDAVFTTSHVKLNFALVIFLAALTAAVFGIILGAPTLRLRGDYLAIVTLGFGEIFVLVAQNWDGATRGPNGIAGIPNLVTPNGFDFGKAHTVFGVSLPYFANYYYLLLVVLAAVCVIFTRLNDSKIGRGWVAIREDEIAAQAMGVNTWNLKLLAFAMGAFLSGAAGSVQAHLSTSVTPDSYVFLESVTLLAAVVLGGMGTLPGAILGMTILRVMPEKFRSFQDFRLMLFGLALILIMRYRPEGIIPSRRRQLEFHDQQSGADAMSAPVGPAS
jgi:branched-chain amino acid transport system permease protein